MIYALGHGASGINATSPIDGKILALTGEAEDSTPPSVLTLPSTCVYTKGLICPTDKELTEKLTKEQKSPLITLQGEYDVDPKR